MGFPYKYHGMTTREEVSVKIITANWLILTVVIATLFIITSPVAALLSGGPYTTVSVIHGTLATLGVVVGTVTGYLGWRLFIGQIRAYNDLKVLSIFSAILAALTIVFGNWIYIAYRAPGGPRAFFLANNPAIHKVFFELKEFIALFPLPLAVAATFIIWRYADDLPFNRPLRTSLAVVFAIAWISLMATFLLGAAITKIQGI